jgi:hypothetical protein
MPELPDIPPVSPLERIFSRPSWADPLFMLASNAFSYQTVAIGAGATVRIAPNDPKRWCLIITQQIPATSPTTIYPNGVAPLLGIVLGVSTNLFRISLFEYGPLVSYDWYATNASAVNLGIWSIQVGPK